MVKLLLQQSSAYIQFVNSLRSKETKLHYTNWLNDFLKYLGDISCDKVLELEAKQLQQKIIDYIINLKDNRRLSPSSIRSHISAVQTFLLINDFEGINWIKVKKFMGEFYKTADDRPSLSNEQKKFGTVITKIAGDSLVVYFPQTSNKNDKRAFENDIECGITMLAAFDFINSKMTEEGLPSVGYRISSDYGRSDIARSHRSNTYDLFGSTMNICAEINRIATPNTMVVGGYLYQIIKSFPSFLEDYLCKLAGEHRLVI